MNCNLCLYFYSSLASSPTRPLYPPPPPPTLPKQRRLSFFERITGTGASNAATSTTDYSNTYATNVNHEYNNANNTTTTATTTNNRVTSTGGYGNDVRRKLTLFTGSTYNPSCTNTDPNNSRIVITPTIQ